MPPKNPKKRAADAKALQAPDAKTAKTTGSINVDHMAEVSAAWERVMGHLA